MALHRNTFAHINIGTAAITCTTIQHGTHHVRHPHVLWFASPGFHIHPLFISFYGKRKGFIRRHPRRLYRVRPQGPYAHRDKRFFVWFLVGIDKQGTVPQDRTCQRPLVDHASGPALRPTSSSGAEA